mmetsp:Transcript_40555/g.87029  ORF Transcript_40555/g.87029 Transcript_40555/m.87029 type:complete len:402 (-) Transcript_40555:739-1944(-)
MSGNFERATKDRTDDHSKASATSTQLLRHGAVAMRLLGEIGQVDAQTEHVALVPVMLLRAVLAVVVAQCCAQPFATRDRAHLGSFGIGRWLQAMLIQDIQDVVVGAMVQLSDNRFFLVLVAQVSTILLMQPGEGVVLDGADLDDRGVGTVVERGALHELFPDLGALGTPLVNFLQIVLGIRCRERLVLAPTGVREAEVAAPTVSSNPPWTPHGRRSMGVVDCDEPFDTIFDKGPLVEFVHDILGNRASHLHMSLLVLAAGDVDSNVLSIVGSVDFKEPLDISLQAVVVDVGMKEAHPEGIGGRHAHSAKSVFGNPVHDLLPFGAPPRQGQDPKQLLVGLRIVMSFELDDVLRQNLARLCDDIVLLGLHPDVVSIIVARVGRLHSQAKTANQHVLLAVTIVH